MDSKLLKTQLLTDLKDKGCSDALVLHDVIDQTITSQDILSSYRECLSFALSLYEARMWGRKKSNDMIKQEQKRREKKFSEPAPCLATPVRQPGEDEIRIGSLILRKKKK